MIKFPSPSFINGFLFTAALLFVLNLADYARLKLRIADTPEGHHIFEKAGFPVPFYEYSMGFYFGLDRFLIWGIVLDYLFVVAVAATVGACSHCLKASKARQGKRPDALTHKSS